MTPCWNSHRGVSDRTFEVLIWSSAENRLPARSRLWSGQSTDRAPFCCAEETVAAETVMTPRKTRHRLYLIVQSLPNQRALRTAKTVRHWTGLVKTAATLSARCRRSVHC